MADCWGQYLNFKPAGAEECQAAKTACGANACCAQGPPSCNNPNNDSETIVGTSSKITNLLGDTVMGKNGDVAVSSFVGPGKVVGLFYSGHWCPPSRTFTPTLIEFYKRFKDNHPTKALEIVFISSDRSEKEFNDYFGEMPWLALPYHDRSRRQTVSTKFNVSGIPTLILLDGATGNLITKDGRSIPTEDPQGLEYPWKPKAFMETITEGKLVDNSGVEYDVNFALKDKVVGVFFSGHWCPPSQQFTPKLIAAYNRYQKQGKHFEVVFCSWDRSRKEFDEYFAEMPWFAIPYEDKRARQLIKLYGVTGIPHLSIVDTNGQLITMNGRSHVEEDPEGVDFPWYRKPLPKLSKAEVRMLNNNPCIILIAEKESEKADIDAVLLEIATEYHAKGPDQDIFFMYAIAESDDGILKALLQLIKQENPEFPFLMLTDIPKRKYYIRGTNGGAGNIRQMIMDYNDGRLDGNKLG